VCFRWRARRAHSFDVKPSIDRLLVVASRQHGAFRDEQARQEGLSPRAITARVADGIWLRTHPGVLIVAGHPRTWHTELSAAPLARPGGLASHRAGATLRELDGFDVAPLEITVEANRRARLSGVIVHRSTVLDPQDVAVVSGIPTTTAARMLCDLGAVVPDDRVERALDAVCRQGTTEDEIIATLDRVDRPGASGTRALRRVLGRPHRDGALPESWFERLLDHLLQSPRLPRFERQYELRDGGRVIARFDAAAPSLRLGVEAHSDAWHHGPRRGERDRRRDRAIAERGWDCVYLSWGEVRDPWEAEASLLRICRQRASMLGLDPATWLPLRTS